LNPARSTTTIKEIEIEEESFPFHAKVCANDSLRGSGPFRPACGQSAREEDG